MFVRLSENMSHSSVDIYTRSDGDIYTGWQSEIRLRRKRISTQSPYKISPVSATHTYLGAVFFFASFLKAGVTHWLMYPFLVSILRRAVLCTRLHVIHPLRVIKYDVMLYLLHLTGMPCTSSPVIAFTIHEPTHTSAPQQIRW